MGKISSTGPSAPAIRNKATPFIQNISIPVEDVITTLTPPSTAIEFSLKARKDSRLEVSYTLAFTTFLTVWPGGVYKENGLTSTASVVLYVRASKGSEVIELWGFT